MAGFEYKPEGWNGWEEWEKKFFFFPRRTIGGKFRLGYLYRHIKFYTNPPYHVKYATPKEYFVLKMKNA